MEIASNLLPQWRNGLRGEGSHGGTPAPAPSEPEALHKHCIAVGSIEISGIQVQHHCPTLLQVELSALTYFATAYFAQLLFCGGSSTRESRGTDVNEVLPKRFHSLA